MLNFMTVLFEFIGPCTLTSCLIAAVAAVVALFSLTAATVLAAIAVLLAVCGLAVEELATRIESSIDKMSGD